MSLLRSFAIHLWTWVWPRAALAHMRTQLEAAEHFNAGILAIATDAIITIDANQRIILFNAGAERIFGYTAAEAIGQPLDILLPTRFVEAHRRHVRAFGQGAESSRLMDRRSEIAGLRKNGDEFPAEASITRVKHSGTMTFTVVLQDISERKQSEAKLRRSEERFRKVFAYSNDAILIVDPETGAFIDVNPAACHMFGYTVEEFQTLTLADIYPDGSQRFKAFTAAVIDQGTSWTDELICKTKAGNEVPTEVSASLIAFSERTLMVALFRDISERKRIEAMREAFVSNVSHELRTPITSIRVLSHLMQKRPEKQEEYLARLLREIDRLAIMVDDLLNLSVLDQSVVPLHHQPIDLNALAGKYVHDRQIVAESEGLVLDANLHPGLPPARGEPGLIGQVLSILLANAFNYTPHGGRVTVSTFAARDDLGAWVGLRVSDTGLGIQPEEQPQVFKRFYRGSAGKDSGQPGTGLGLAIAKEIINQHNGRIAIKSSGIPGEGTTFSVWLPAATPRTKNGAP